MQNRVARHTYEGVKVQLDLALNNQIPDLEYQIRNLRNEKSALKVTLTDLKNSFIWINNKFEQRFIDFANNVAEKMTKLLKRVERVTSTFVDSVKYSSKTYFLQEINRVKHERDLALQKAHIYHEKMKLMREALAMAKP